MNITANKSHLFAKWMSYIFLLISLILLIYTYYRAEIYYAGASTMYFKYYVISLFGIIFWISVLLMPSGVRANIVTLVTSIVICLYFIEIGLTYFQIQEPDARERSREASKLGIEYDKRTKFEVIEDLIESGEDAVPSMGPKHSLSSAEKILPLGGISNKTTVATNENGYFMIYRSDRYGFNNPDSEWDVLPIEWLLTGDSFTEGLAVRPGEDIAGQIRALSNESVINLGRSGNGPLMELAELKEYAEVIKPKKVIWLYYEENDLRDDINRDKKNPFLMQYLNDEFSQNLINKQIEIDQLLVDHLIEFKEQASLGKTRWIRLYKLRELIGFDKDKNRANEVITELKVDIEDPIFSNILSSAKKRVESWDGQLYFVYLPEYDRYAIKDIASESYRSKAEVLKIVKTLQIPIIDIDKNVFSVLSDPLALFPFGKKGHYNANGYSEVAKEIVRSVKKHDKN
jgi:hypothetical protein